MYIRATAKLKEFKYDFAERNNATGLSNGDFIAFMKGDHMEVNDTLATNLINNGLAQEVWKRTS